MNDRRFLDTNVLAYSFDSRDPDRKRIAASIVEAECLAGSLTVSIQVLQEFYSVVTKKFNPPVPPSVARGAIERLLRYTVVEPTKSMLSEALDLTARRQLSIWDSMIVVAARKAGCGALLTEDLGHATTIDGVRIVNPFRSGAANPRP